MRGNTKHGAHLDGQMAKEMRDRTQGSAAGSRTQEWQDVETAGDDQPEVVLLTHGASPQQEGSPTPEEISARSELGRWIPRSILPADRQSILMATADTAPAHVVDQLGALPSNQIFQTVFDVWQALGHDNETRS